MPSHPPATHHPPSDDSLQPRWLDPMVAGLRNCVAVARIKSSNA